MTVSVRRWVTVTTVALALPACAGKKTKVTKEQWVEDCVFERTLPRDQCEDMWAEAHPDRSR